jgi:glucokinase
VAANVLTADDVVVVVSSTSRIAELNAAVDTALERGAQVIAITANQSPLAKRATITIAIDHSEDVATQVPMISRILYLLIIDILAVGVAMRTGAQEMLLPDAAKARANRGADATGNRLARMVSHTQE